MRCYLMYMSNYVRQLDTSFYMHVEILIDVGKTVINMLEKRQIRISEISSAKSIFCREYLSAVIKTVCNRKMMN